MQPTAQAVITKTQCEPPSQRWKESFLQDKVENGEILVQHVPGTDNVADLQTKNLSATQTWYHIVQLGLEERLTRSAFLSGDALSVGCILFACLKGHATR